MLGRVVSVMITKLYKIYPVFHCAKQKFSIKDFFSKCYQIYSFLQIWSRLLKKFLQENFIFCTAFVAVLQTLIFKLHSTKN